MTIDASVFVSCNLSAFASNGSCSSPGSLVALASLFRADWDDITNMCGVTVQDLDRRSAQNPMDVDYRALSNAGMWFVGRLQTDADRERVVEAMASDGGLDGLEPRALSDMVKTLSRRWFVMRDVHRAPALSLLESRTMLSWMRGPMTREDLRVLARRG